MAVNTNKTKSKNILNGKVSLVVPILKDQVEGKDYINVSMGSTTELGKRLAQKFCRSFNTPFGKIISIKAFSNWITTPGFPVEFLNKFKLTKEDISRIPKERISVPNYWSLISLVTYEKIKSDKELQEMIINNEAPYTTFEKFEDKEFFNMKISQSIPDYGLGKYIAIIRYMEAALKEGKFNDEFQSWLIMNTKDDPEKDIMDGIEHCKPNSTSRLETIKVELPTNFEVTPNTETSEPTPVETEEPKPQE